MECKPTLLMNQEQLVPRENMLFCLCPICANEINWRHVEASYELTGECCCYAMRAKPGNHNMAVYIVQVKPADMTNVSWLHRKSALVGPPPKRYG